jgi:dihydrolipoamide dehydrogenase
VKEYDLISIGTGSAMSLVEAMIQENPKMKVAVIDKDPPGGICLTRGCIPSKILLYPAELVRTIEKAGRFGIDIAINSIDFRKVMERMRTLISKDIEMIRRGLSRSRNIDYYPAQAEFVAPYTLKVGNETITSKTIFLCTGSKPAIPPIAGLNKVVYDTSDTVLKKEQLPESIAIVGGGYIAAEYGHFFSALGSKVAIIGRNPQFLKQEEPEVSALAKRELEKHMTVLTNHAVNQVYEDSSGKKVLVATNRETGEKARVKADEILIATGRSPNTDILHPERGGIETDEKGWIAVNRHLETSSPNVWALGDANGKHLFKHAANYEAQVVYYNAVLKRKVEADYHAIPHAVFTYPEIASVGLREKEAIQKFGKENVLIGMYKYENTAKGEAMDVRDYFVKAIVEKNTMKILGAHIIGPYASVLVQEVVNLMYTSKQSAEAITSGMHIHPALNEVVERAFRSLVSVDHYHHREEHQPE